MTSLKIYRMHPNVELPKFATEGSACFDLQMNDAGKQEYIGYTSFNKLIKRPAGGKIFISPGDRVLVPTGLIFDIPEGYSLRVHPRSGLSLKQGLVLANCEGVIDSDYVEELMIMLHNTSQNGITVSNGDRLAQAELVRVEQYAFEEIHGKPDRKTSRDGGLGSTGVSDRRVFNVDVGTMPTDEAVEALKKSFESNRGRRGIKRTDVERYPDGRIKYDRRKKKPIDNAESA